MISEERRLNQFSAYESALMEKWNTLLDNMVNSCEQQKKGLGFISKQIEYITVLFRALLVTKSITLADTNVSFCEMKLD